MLEATVQQTNPAMTLRSRAGPSKRLDFESFAVFHRHLFPLLLSTERRTAQDGLVNHMQVRDSAQKSGDSLRNQQGRTS